MSIKNILNLAEKFQSLANNEDTLFVFDAGDHLESHGDPLTEHDGMEQSYMSKENLESILRYSQKTLDMLAEEDDLPDWCDDKLSVAKHLVEDVYNYIANQKE